MRCSTRPQGPACGSGIPSVSMGSRRLMEGSWSPRTAGPASPTRGAGQRRNVRAEDRQRRRGATPWRARSAMESCPDARAGTADPGGTFHEPVSGVSHPVEVTLRSPGHALAPHHRRSPLDALRRERPGGARHIAPLASGRHRWPPHVRSISASDQASASRPSTRSYRGSGRPAACLHRNRARAGLPASVAAQILTTLDSTDRARWRICARRPPPPRARTDRVDAAGHRQPRVQLRRGHGRRRIAR